MRVGFECACKGRDSDFVMSAVPFRCDSFEIGDLQIGEPWRLNIDFHNFMQMQGQAAAKRGRGEKKKGCDEFRFI